MSSSEEVVASQLIGQVKWFSNIKNYGFISVVSPGDYNNQEIFVHQTQIKTEGYRTLRQGEYVSFDLSPNNTDDSSNNGQSSSHQFIATNITGVLGGTLMCEQQRHFGGNGENDNRSNDNDGDGFTTYRRHNNRNNHRNGDNRNGDNRNRNHRN